MKAAYDREIIPADKKYRNRMIKLLLLGIGAGGIMALVFLPSLFGSRITAGDKVDLVFHMLNAGLMLLFLILFPFALYLLGIGKLTIATQRFPPPGIRVIRDTLLIRGDKAVMRGRVMIVSSIILIVLAIWGILRVYRLAQIIGV